eukprot:436583-Prymnesium_polylepis.1
MASHTRILCASASAHHARRTTQLCLHAHRAALPQLCRRSCTVDSLLGRRLRLPAAPTQVPGGEIRLTVEQNVILPNVPDDQ